MATIERTTRLNVDDEMVDRMEKDLMTKALAVFAEAGVDQNVHGVFSLDDLENLNESDLCRKIAVGVGYAGAEPTSDRVPGNTAPGGNTARQVDFVFHIILAVPHGPECEERISATRLLTVLRRSVLGKTCSGDATNRAWAFVKEFPNTDQSDDRMLYYSQVWRLTLPVPAIG